MTTKPTSLEQILLSARPPRDKAAAATQVLRRGASTDQVQAILRALPALRPLAPREGTDAAPFLSLIDAARGEAELAASLAIALRDSVTPLDPNGPAGKVLSSARITDLTSREALWHTAAALSTGPVVEAFRKRYAQLYPYWRDPRSDAGARVLILNRLPNLREPMANFVHNQSNIPKGYAEAEATSRLAMDVFFLIGTDFDAACADMARPDVVYNNVTSAEVLAREGHAETIHRIAAHFDVPLINAPDTCAPYTRSGNADRIGEQAHFFFPKTHRFDAGFDVPATTEQVTKAFDLPVIIRDPYGHMGAVATLAHTADAVTAALEALREVGAYVIQYYDFPQKNGLYYRYRMFKIGDAVFPSRIHTAQGWNVHGTEHDALKASRPELGLVALEQQFWDAPTSLVPQATWTALEQMMRDTKADTLGCDFTLAPDGRALIFEMNASMHYPFQARAAFKGQTPFNGATAFEQLCGLASA